MRKSRKLLLSSLPLNLLICKTPLMPSIVCGILCFNRILLSPDLLPFPTFNPLLSYWYHHLLLPLHMSISQLAHSCVDLGSCLLLNQKCMMGLRISMSSSSAQFNSILLVLTLNPLIIKRSLLSSHT